MSDLSKELKSHLSHMFFVNEALVTLQELVGNMEMGSDERRIIHTEISLLQQRHDKFYTLALEQAEKEDSSLFKKSRPKVFVRDGGRCRYCQKDLVYEDVFHIDHIFPKARGGDSKMNNLALSCPKCNTKKNCRTPEEAGMFLL